MTLPQPPSSFPQGFITTPDSKPFILSPSYYNTQATRPNNLSKMTPPQRPHPVRSSSSPKPPFYDEESQPLVPLYDRESQLIHTFFYPQGWYQRTIVYLLAVLLTAFCLCLLTAEVAGVTYLVKVSIDIFREIWLGGE